MFSFEKVTAVLGKLRNKTPNNLYLLLSQYNSTCLSHLDFDVQDITVQYGQGKQSLYWSGQFLSLPEVKVPRIKTIGT